MIRTIALTALLVACALAGATLAARAVVADDSPPRDLAVYLEAEGMLPALESFAGPETGSPEQAIARRQANCCGVLWSSNAQVLFENHTANNRMTLRFEVPEDGSYAVVAVVTRAPDFGVYDFAIDGRPVGARFDAYSPGVARSDPLYLGRLELAEGSHTLTLAVADKNPASSNYFAGLDYIELRGGGS